MSRHSTSSTSKYDKGEVWWGGRLLASAVQLVQEEVPKEAVFRLGFEDTAWIDEQGIADFLKRPRAVVEQARQAQTRWCERAA